MELKPASKQTEIGEVPEEWSVCQLDSFWSVTDCKHVTADFVPNGYPVASIREVQSRFVDLSNANETTLTFYTQLTEGGRKPSAGDLILSRNATVGELAQVVESHPPFAMGQDVCLLRKRLPEFSTDYLQSVFRSKIVTRQINDSMVGSTFKRINVQHVKSLIVPMPSPIEQGHIAEVLSDADALIESLEQLLGKKRQIKQGAMQELLTGKKRLPGFTGRWSPKAIGDLLQIHHGKSQRAVESLYGPYPILATGGQIGNANRFLCDQPSVLIGRKGTIDQPQYMDEPFWCVDTLFYSTVIEPNNPKFLFYCFCLIPWRQYNEASGVPSLNARTIEQLELIVPSGKEQEAIAAILSDMDAEIESLQAKLDKARQLKQGMMQDLLTGRIRLVQPSVKVISFSANKSSSAAELSHNTHFNEAVMIAVLSATFGSEKFPLGRFRRTKFSYLLHRHVEHEAAGFMKKAAGPYNPRTRYGGAEKIALQNRYVRILHTEKGEGFVAAENIAQAEGYFDKWYGAEALTWLEQFRYQKNDALELLTTVDMACEDLSRVGKAATLSAVKQIIQDSPEWKAKLNRAVFSDDNIATTIQSCGQLFPVEEE